MAQSKLEELQGRADAQLESRESGSEEVCVSAYMRISCVPLSALSAQCALVQDAFLVPSCLFDALCTSTFFSQSSRCPHVPCSHFHVASVSNTQKLNSRAQHMLTCS